MATTATFGGHLVCLAFLSPPHYYFGGYNQVVKLGLGTPISRDGMDVVIIHSG